jgi:hypothetical protein
MTMMMPLFLVCDQHSSCLIISSFDVFCMVESLETDMFIIVITLCGCVPDCLVCSLLKKLWILSSCKTRESNYENQLLITLVTVLVGILFVCFLIVC